MTSIGRPARAAGLVPLTEEECWNLLRSHDLGRIAIVIDGLPVVFPVNYATGDGAVVFRTAPGTKLDKAPLAAVCFEIDGYDQRSATGWSVILSGVASEVTNAADRLGESLRRLPLYPAAPGLRQHWIAVYADAVSGRYFTGGAVVPPLLAQRP